MVLAPLQVAGSAGPAVHCTPGGNVDVLGNKPSVSKVYSPTARLPRKLVSKIQNLEFIEMSELLPEAWISDAADDSVGQKSQSRRRSPISEISVWVECFAMMAAVLAEKFPSKAPQLFIYMRRIVHAARNYRGTS